MKKIEPLRNLMLEERNQYEQNLKLLKNQNKKDLNSLETSWNQKLKLLENSKPKLRLEYEAILKGNTNKLLKELVIEMYKEETNCPKELKAYLNYGDYLTVMQMEKQLLKDIEKESKQLKMELGKNGINEEWFWGEFEKNDNKN